MMAVFAISGILLTRVSRRRRQDEKLDIEIAKIH